VQIGETCFRECVLDAIAVPCSVEALGKSSFSNAIIVTITFEAGAKLTRIEEASFQCCASKSSYIPSSVEVLGQLSFAGARIEKLTSEPESHLKRIEEDSFLNSAVEFLSLSIKLDVVDLSVFTGRFIEVITVDGNNRRHAIRQDLLIDESTALHDFRNGSDVLVGRDITVLGEKYFDRAKIESITFEVRSGLLRIKEECFSNSALKSLTVPRSVEFLANHVS
jgi:hypothetical protein